MKHPNREECEALLAEYGTPEHVKGHCRAVAKTAYLIARALNRAGCELDLDVILSAGLLHDIARVQDKHWDVGADLMEQLGYQQEAEIIRAHMFYDPFSELSQVTETDMVCLGDRLVKEDAYVGLDERIEYIIAKAQRNGKPEAIPFILKKKEDTRRFIAAIERKIGTSLDALLAEYAAVEAPERQG